MQTIDTRISPPTLPPCGQETKAVATPCRSKPVEKEEELAKVPRQKMASHTHRSILDTSAFVYYWFYDLPSDQSSLSKVAKTANYPEIAVPPFVEVAVAESQTAEPPSYTSQSKPRGRKPKQGAAKKPGRKANGKKTKGAKSNANKGRKANKRGKETEEVEEDAEFQEGQDSGLGSSTDTKKHKSNTRQDKGKHANHGEREVEGTGLGSSTDTLGKNKVKPAPARKRKSAADPAPVPVAVPTTVPTLEDMEQHAGLPTADLGKLGYINPPEWVGYRNVYSNSYRRSMAQGMPHAEVRSWAKLHSKVFTDHGLVHPALLSSFSPKARKDGGSKPTNVDWISESLMFMKGLEHKVVFQTHSFWHVTYMLRIPTYGIDRGRGGARVSQVKSFFLGLTCTGVWMSGADGSNELICNPHALSICML